MTLRLDVGCGNRACGDVNVDLFPNNDFHRARSSRTMRYQLIPNFIVADAQHLPFVDTCFDEIFSSHVIEHVPNPYQFVREMVRVSKNKITVICPHRFGKDAKLQGHVNFFNLKWFEQVLNRFPEVYSFTTEVDWRGLPINSSPLFRVPNQITVEVRVNKVRSKTSELEMAIGNFAFESIIPAR